MWCSRYVLDLGGELAAFDGELLRQQTAFALAALATLRALHGGADQGAAEPIAAEAAGQGGAPGLRRAAAPGVMLIGHSMGGVVAAAAAAAAPSYVGLGAQSRLHRGVGRVCVRVGGRGQGAGANYCSSSSSTNDTSCCLQGVMHPYCCPAMLSACRLYDRAATVQDRVRLLCW